MVLHGELPQGYITNLLAQTHLERTKKVLQRLPSSLQEGLQSLDTYSHMGRYPKKVAGSALGF